MLTKMGPMSESRSSLNETTHTSKRRKCHGDESPRTNFSWCEPEQNTLSDRTSGHTEDGDHPFGACPEQSRDQSQPNPDMTRGSCRVEVISGCLDTGTILRVTSEPLELENVLDPTKDGFVTDTDHLEQVSLRSELVATKEDEMDVDSENRICTDATENLLSDRLNTPTDFDTSIENDVSPVQEEEDVPLGSPSSDDQNNLIDINNPSEPDQSPVTNNSRTSRNIPAKHRHSKSSKSSQGRAICTGCQPASLQELSVKAALVRLGSAVWRWRDQFQFEDGGRMRGIADFRKSVPAHIRQLLQEAVLADWRVWDTRSLRLLQLLLSRDCCTSVRVQQVRLFFRDAFIRLLPPLTRLVDLRIQDCDWSLTPAQESLLCAALSQMPLLRLLSLRHIATNAVLATAVGHCSNLLVLDLLCSSRITCTGALQLPVGHTPHPPQPFSAPHRRWLLPHCCVRLLEWLGAAITHRSSGEFSQEAGEEECVQCQYKSFRADHHQELKTSLPGGGLEAGSPSAAPNCLCPVEDNRISDMDEKRAAAEPVLRKLLFLDLRGTSVSLEAAQLTASSLPRTEVLYFTHFS